MYQQKDKQEIINEIADPVIRKIVEHLFSKGYSCEGVIPFPADRFSIWDTFVRRLGWPRIFRNGSDGEVVICPTAGRSASMGSNLSPCDVNAIFAELLASLTILMRGGFPLKDLHFAGGGSIQIPAWFLAAMRALGVNVHVDEEEDSWAEPRPEPVID